MDAREKLAKLSDEDIEGLLSLIEKSKKEAHTEAEDTEEEYIFRPKSKRAAKQVVKDGSKGKKLAVIQPISDGKNIKIIDTGEHKKDAEIDKLLAPKPNKKSYRDKSLILAECEKCERVYKISNKLIRDDTFICNSCQGRSQGD